MRAMPFPLIKQSFVITFLSQVFEDNWKGTSDQNVTLYFGKSQE